MTDQTAPKLFISYSWSSPEHEEWVLTLASELMSQGIEVIFDKWDLREGQEANAFMEQMVSDPTVTKVILICDKKYVEKANTRAGGVGSEAQIISAEIFRSVTNTKFVAVLRERDDEGRALVPTYYTTRIYIDLSESASYAEQFERLVRWAHDEPLHQRPALGAKPAFLSTQAVSLATSADLRRAIDALKGDKPKADAAVGEYLRSLAKGMEKLQLSANSETPFDDILAKSIEDFTPYRNEFIQLALTVAQYRDSNDVRRHFHRFFEALLAFYSPFKSGQRYVETDQDNYRFIVHELFLYFLASLIREERFEFVSDLLSRPFVASWANEGAVDFSHIRQYIESFLHHAQRLNIRPEVVRAKLLKERASASGFEFSELMQVDLILYLRDRTLTESEWTNWYPETLLYATSQRAPFEVFARAQSQRYFEKLAPLLAVNDTAHLEQVLSKLQEQPDSLPRWGWQRLSPAVLTGTKNLASRP